LRDKLHSARIWPDETRSSECFTARNRRDADSSRLRSRDLSFTDRHLMEYSSTSALAQLHHGQRKRTENERRTDRQTDRPGDDWWRT